MIAGRSGKDREDARGGKDEQAVERRRVRQQVELKKDGKELGVMTVRLLNQSQEKRG